MSIVGIGICDGCKIDVTEKPGLKYGKDEGSTSNYCQACYLNEVWKQNKISVEQKVENWAKKYIMREI